MAVKDLSIDFLGVHFDNPFCLASSPVGNCYEMCRKAYQAGWGGVYFKSVAPASFVINEVSPRFDTLKKEGTDFVGFKNMEQTSERPFEDSMADMARLKKEFPNKVLIASIMGPTEADWTELARRATATGADMLELNFSCPQMTTHAMGSDVGTNPELCEKYVAAAKRGTDLPIVAKMTPNITDMVPSAEAALRGGAAGISAINTVKSIANLDLQNLVGMPMIDGKSSVSGYSGKAVKPIALRFVNELYKRIPGVQISGIGGIETWEDAAEFILLGARNLQVCTAIMEYGYRIIDDLTSGLAYYMEERGVDHLEDLVGLASENMLPAEELDRSYKVYPAFDMDKCVGCGRCYVSCYDGAHQALAWDEEKRRPVLDRERCVGCHLCALVCPARAISKGDVVIKPGFAGDPATKKVC
ncbi:MAG: NAD-dependent dihydropyrimidine dehydrogenase subunit PreA [Olsenella sp.]|jgi:dihydropyrimidine dehydrogenase (NAD+) subunit PreA|nr:NAD-dependent dihydropyrimidine dehydrogenase subunit PreA [Olsenella sp.]MDY3970418.1 NAD-dependent dihydropyrimidine dehydrogenase subunit PreA [Atopobiaceae bacterium]MDY5275819.1 NAD-dependent dihydropyrimidine dehydrogenase subunit PreA [Atopobiaceae bacterium]